MNVGRLLRITLGVSLLSAGSCTSGSDVPGAPDELQAWSAEGPSIRIGAVDDPEYAFGYVRALAEGPDGRLYSLHSRETAIRRWTSAGEPDGVVGREGEGPGEFIQPFGLGFFGDSLWVMDLRAYRVSFFDGSGSYLGGATPKVDLGGPESRERSPARPEVPLRDGSFYGRSPAWSDAIARGQLTEVPHVHMDSAGMVDQTIWVQPYRTTDILGLVREVGGTFAPQPFGDEFLTGLTPDGSLLVLDRRVSEEPAPSFSLTKLDMSGDTAFRSEVPYEAVVLERSEVDSAVAVMTDQLFDFMSRGNADLSRRSLQEDIEAAMYAPPTRPAVREMVVSGSGHVWLKRAEALGGEAIWLVLDDEGRPLAQVETPPEMRVLAIYDTHLWGVETDDLDVNYIVRYELSTSGQ